MRALFLLLLAMSLFVASCQQSQRRSPDPLPQAASLLGEGRPWQAYNLLLRAQEDYKDQADYWFLRGQAALRCGNLNEAVRSLEIAVSLAPKEPRYLIKLGYLYVVTNCYSKAASVAKRLLEIDPKNPYAHLILGQVEAFSGEMEEARREIEHALAQNPKDYQLYLDAGDLYLLARDFSRAEAMYKEAQRLKPRNPEVYLAISNLYLVQGRLEEAEEQILTALKWAQKRGLPLANYRVYLAEFYVRANKPQKALAIFQELAKEEKNNPFYGLRLAEIAIMQRRFELARETLAALEKKFPELFEIPYLKGHLALLQGRYKDAIEFFAQAASMSEEDARVFFYLGLTQWLSGFRQQARINLKKAVSKDPLLVDAKLILAALEMEANEPTLARATLLDLLPYEPRAYQLSLALSLQEGDCLRARKEIDLLKKTGHLPPLFEEIYQLRCLLKSPRRERLPLQAWSLFRDHPEDLPRHLAGPKEYALALEAAIYREKGKKKAAQEVLAQMRKETPVSLYLKALAALENGSPQTAIYLLEETVSRVPFFEAEALLGELYLQEKDYRAAARAFRRALVIEPKDPLVLNNLVWTLIRMSQEEGKPLPEEAVKSAEKLLELAPNDPAFLDTVATVYHLTGMKEVACRTWRRARGLAPDDRVVSQHLSAACP